MLRAEPGQQISCGGCGALISVPLDYGYAVQTAPPPVQTGYATQTRDYPQVQPQTVPTAPVQPVQQQTPQYPPEVLAQAKAKRDRWGWRGVLTALVQALLIAVAMGFEHKMPENASTWLVMLWLMSQVPAAMLLAWLRPDDAYLEKAPRPKSRGILFCLLLAALIPLTGFFGVMLGAILMMLQ